MRSRLLPFIATVLGLATAAAGQNLVNNGDFALGDFGFGTGYQYIPYDYANYEGTHQIVDGDYTVGYHVPRSYFDWDPFQDVSGSGQFMIVNGATSPLVFWSQTVNVQPNTFYAISFYLAEVSNPSSQANISASVGGTTLGSVVIPSVKDVWAQYTYTWFSGTQTTVQLTFTDLNTSIGGNDFGIDDISMTKIASMFKDFTLTPKSVVGGTAATGEIDLNAPAAAGGTVVTLTSSQPFAGVPPAVTIPAGSTSAKFPVATFPVALSSTATLTATLNGVKKTATITVDPPVLTALALSPASVIGGANSTGTVTLGSAAPAAGWTVDLKSGSTFAAVPATVKVAGGATTAQFTIKSIPVATNSTATISASAGSVTKTKSLTVEAPSFATFTLDPTSVVGGSSSTGTVTIGSAAPTGGMTVKLSSNSSFATVPATATVAAGATSVQFKITTSSVSKNSSASISATVNGATKSRTLTVKT